MGVQKCVLNLNSSGKELNLHGTFEFPCAGYCEQFTDKQENTIPWHWHKEMEIIYVKSGAFKVQIPSKTFHLECGDCIIINSNIPHYVFDFSNSELQSLVFNPMLITGNNDSIFAKKYMMPLISCTTFDGYFLKAGCHKKITDYFINAFQTLGQDLPDFEFIVREKLSNICLFIYHEFEKEFVIEDKGLNQDNIRIRQMLDFIHNNFSDNLTLAEIAKVTAIGERECLRCFQRTIQLSPIQYLLKYRIIKAAELLVKNPSHTISEIASLCGFNSSSNFSKLFKRFYKYSPREYRNLAIKSKEEQL